MNALTLGILFSILVLIIGIVSLVFLVKFYREQFLVYLPEKLKMTVWLGVLFGGFFLLGNGFFAHYLTGVKENFSWYLDHPTVLAKEGIIFFILNSILILACRSLIKEFSNL